MAGPQRIYNHCNKFLSRRRMVTFITLLSGRVVQEDTFSSSRVKFRSVFTWDMNKNSASKYFRRKSQAIVYGKNNFSRFQWEFWSQGLLTAVRIASSQKVIRTFLANISARATSRRCLFFRSATPFCWGVSTHVDWWIMPLWVQHVLRLSLKFLVPLSELITCIWTPNCVCIIL